MDYGPATPQSTESPAPGRARRSEMAAASHRQARASRLRVPESWPLWLVLVVQALLTIRLFRSDTAFQDEALYLWAGHLEWAHVLHGGSLPQFPAYFSGAPAIYPPLAALADGLGGLTGARALSMIFMLGATTVLWSAASRLYGRRAAFFATALFAILGPTLHLGSFATYDALSVFLVALAAWFVIRAADRPDATGWVLAAGVTLALANATSYASALFDPVVLLLALVIALPKPGGKLAAGRVLVLAAITVSLVAVALLLGGSRYIHGVALTTVSRVEGTDSVPHVLADAWAWTGVVAIIAFCGVIASWVTRPKTSRSWLLTLLTAAVILAPAEQASIHTTASLNKHVVFGAWFAAIAAGYAVDRLLAAVPDGNMRAVTFGACVVALSFPVSLGVGQSRVFATSWPNSSAFVAIFGPLADHSSGRLLVEDPSIAEYYLPSGSQWQRWSSTRNIVLPGGTPTGGPSARGGIIGAGNAGTFAMYIRQGYFSFIALNFADTTSLDKSIAADIHRNRHYHSIQVVPYGSGPAGPAVGEYVIWQYEPKS
jgi:Dolichyl-phosphate-mannose-protein mannosyltransferase